MAELQLKVVKNADKGVFGKAINNFNKKENVKKYIELYDTLIKEVRNYYSDLKDKSIYYYSGDKNNNGEYIKLDK